MPLQNVIPKPAMIRIWTNRKWDNINKGITNIQHKTRCNRCSTKLDTSGKHMPKSICKTQQRLSNIRSNTYDCTTGTREDV
eukprot:13508850-Ditylum_brightwellii.AAC.1